MDNNHVVQTKKEETTLKEVHTQNKGFIVTSYLYRTTITMIKNTEKALWPEKQWSKVTEHNHLELSIHKIIERSSSQSE